MDLLLPGTAAEEYDVDAFRSLACARFVTQELHDIDPRLSLIWAKPGAKSIEGGYWYIVRRNDHAEPSYWQCNDGQLDPATGQMGYADPGPEHIERLQQIDSHRHPRIYQEYRARQDAARRRGEQSVRDAHEEFRAKLLERLDHLYGSKSRIYVPKDL